MTEQEYIAQNALGYEGDNFIHGELERLCKQYNVSHIIETGTYRGATTKRLATIRGPRSVYTVEVVEKNFEIAHGQLESLLNVRAVLGNSVDILPKWLTTLAGIADGFLFFLDAHWESYNPLLDELKLIADFNLKPVIFIHDFKVPDHPEFGFDSYAGQDYDFEWIKPSIERIYGAYGYDYHYNSEASGAKRGVIYIYPKQ